MLGSRQVVAHWAGHICVVVIEGEPHLFGPATLGETHRHVAVRVDREQIALRRVVLLTKPVIGHRTGWRRRAGFRTCAQSVPRDALVTEELSVAGDKLLIVQCWGEITADIGPQGTSANGPREWVGTNGQMLKQHA